MQVSKQINKPIPNCYWVRPGQLLAGEYPLTLSKKQTADRIQSFLEAGVTQFIDLTNEGEMPAYHPHLPEMFAEHAIGYQRFALVDHGVPDSAQQMAVILDAIDQAIHHKACVYVHCRAGIGRTGMVVGCHLVRQGYQTHEALEALNMLWLESERSKSFLHVPETDAQELFILEYTDLRSVST